MIDPLPQISHSGWSPSERVRKLANDHNSSTPSVGAERAIHYTEFYRHKAKSFKSAQLTNAHSLAYHLRHRTIAIYDHEYIVGTHTEHRIGAICQIEKAGAAMLEDLFRFEKRDTNPLYLAPRARWKLLTSAIPYWLNRSIIMRAFPFIQRIKFAAEQLSGTWFTVNEVGGIGHFLPDYESIIQLGTEGLREKVIAQQAAGKTGEANSHFFEALLVALDAIEDFAERYRLEAQKHGRKDLVKLLAKSPRRPAETLREALQTIWFFQMIVQMESLDQGISLGRMDQYLYPLYLKEQESADFDADRVRDLMAAFCLKLSEVIPLFSSRATKLFSGLPSGQALTIGGINSQGEDSSNELSYIFLDVMDCFKTRQPNWHARVSHNSQAAYLQRVTRVLANGGGSPALYNDDVIMPAMVRRGVSSKKVWNYATVGCVEPALQKESFTSSDAALFNLAINFELVLGNGKQLGKESTGSRPWLSSITSMDELFTAFEKQTREKLDHLKHCLDAIEKANAEYFPTPYSSLTVLGCIDNAKDLSRGGAPYNASGVQAVGVADVANSLAVIDQLVFDRQLYSLEEIANACADDFDGQELLRARAQKITKFGNDNEISDYWAQRVTEMFDKLVSTYSNSRGGQWMPGFYSMTCHQAFGEKTSALPSGRYAGKPLADGLAPVDGTDILGPTASLNSVARLDQERFANGINLNIKFDADTVSGEDGRVILEALLKGYFSQGGMQVQINVLDPKVLEEAMADPESHRNLLVRISGYSAYFVDLTPEMQQEIIDRSCQKAR